MEKLVYVLLNIWMGCMVLVCFRFQECHNFCSILNLLTLGLICSLQISLFNNAPILSISPFPCLVAKKIQISEHPLILPIDVVK